MPHKDKNLRRKCQALSRRRRVAAQRAEILKLLGGKCKKCGFDDSRALAIDHINGGGTKERKDIGGGYYSYVLKKIKSGSLDYQILCCNCNQIKKIEQSEERETVH